MSYPSPEQARAFYLTQPIDNMYNHDTGEITDEGEALIATALDLIQAACWQVAQSKGFHDSGRSFGEEMALIHSEVSEALESWRNNEPGLWFLGNDGQKYSDPYNEDGTPRKPEGRYAELADVIVRIGDTAEGQQFVEDMNASLAEAFIYKFRYNLTRGYKHGKIA